MPADGCAKLLAAASFISAVLGRAYDSRGPSMVVWNDQTIVDRHSDHSGGWAGYIVTLLLVDAASNRVTLWLGQGIAAPFSVEQKMYAIMGWSTEHGVEVAPHVDEDDDDVPAQTAPSSATAH